MKNVFLFQMLIPAGAEAERRYARAELQKCLCEFIRTYGQCASIKNVHRSLRLMKTTDEQRGTHTSFHRIQYQVCQFLQSYNFPSA
jgi:hypothetical protein